MSNNKYIIDEDSLTGIADTVRNKLGTGDANDDNIGFLGTYKSEIYYFSSPCYSDLSFQFNSQDLKNIFGEVPAYFQLEVGENVVSRDLTISASGLQYGIYSIGSSEMNTPGYIFRIPLTSNFSISCSYSGYQYSDFYIRFLDSNENYYTFNIKKITNRAMSYSYSAFNWTLIQKTPILWSPQNIKNKVNNMNNINIPSFSMQWPGKNTAPTHYNYINIDVTNSDTLILKTFAGGPYYTSYSTTYFGGAITANVVLGGQIVSAKSSFSRSQRSVRQIDPTINFYTYNANTFFNKSGSSSYTYVRNGQYTYDVKNYTTVGIHFDLSGAGNSSYNPSDGTLTIGITLL